MINSRIAKATLATALAVATFAGCSLTEAEPDGSALSAQSCSRDLLPISAASNIVQTGIDETSPKKLSQKDLEARVKDNQKRSLLGAAAAATNKYWQPLADAWALEEALARAALLSLLSDKVVDEAGETTIDTSIYDKFLSNVNIDFAAVTKDTYCRIAFLKQNIQIKYED